MCASSLKLNEYDENSFDNNVDNNVDNERLSKLFLSNLANLKKLNQMLENGEVI